MTEERKPRGRAASTGSGIYGLAFIGALVYYLSHATSFLDGLLGVFKALVWPGFLIYELMDYLGM